MNEYIACVQSDPRWPTDVDHIRVVTYQGAVEIYLASYGPDGKQKTYAFLKPDQARLLIAEIQSALVEVMSL